MDDVYALQHRVPDLRVPKTLTVIGAGGTGFWFALFAAMAGVERLVVFEPSTIRPTDVARFPVRPGAVGTSTIIELQELITRLRPSIQFVRHAYHFEFPKHANDIEPPLVLSCDDLVLKHQVAAHCAAKNIEFVIAPYYSDASTVFHNSIPQSLVMSGNSVPNWVGNCALSATLGLNSLFGKPFSAVVSHKSSSSRAMATEIAELLARRHDSSE